MTPGEPTQPIIVDPVLGYLQGLILRAALLGEALPGTDQRIHIPDLPIINEHKPVILLDENLEAHISFNSLSILIRVLSKDEVRAQTVLEGDTVYLHFQPPQFQEGTTHLSLQAEIVSSDPSKQRLGLSGMRIGFRKVDDHWDVFDGPIYFAA
jgi:hypothetical protein